MHIGKPVIYLDGLSKEHEALVKAINPLHPSFVTLVYVDEAAGADNLKVVFDVAHMSHPSKNNIVEVRNRFGEIIEQGNSEIPHYDVNCWKEYDERAIPLPSDHPQFDAPFKLPEVDQNGKIIPPMRSEYERQIAEHQAGKFPPPEDREPVSEALVERDKLRAFLMANFKSETGNETPEACAIRLLTKVKPFKDKK
jgi:hypothetical protein